MVTLVARLGQDGVGATLVVARFVHRVWQQGDHKGHPYS
jgi:hypothetical protein